MRNSGVQAGQPIGLLVAAIVGLAVAFLSGLSLVPRVRLVEVLTVIASAVGSGAGFAAAIVQYTKTRAANRLHRENTRALEQAAKQASNGAREACETDRP
jgi:uncharacterized membrane protein